MKNSLKLVWLLFAFFCISQNAYAKAKREYYQIKIYTIAHSDQEKMIDDYLQNAYIPAMHRVGIKSIGVFKPVATDTAFFGKLIYVYTPLTSLKQLVDLPKKLEKDTDYQAAGKAYIETAFKSPAYIRFENIILQAFTDAPLMNLPKLNSPRNNRIYELRSYESASEKIYTNKVKMFNEGGEVTLFKRLNFNAVFYGEVIAGSHMPNLMYLTTFENKADRDEHWKTFVASPEWIKLKADPQYQNNVSKNTQYFLCPTEYSDF